MSKKKKIDSNIVDATIAERGRTYGDPYDSHCNIGLAWTGLIQQHYGIRLAHPIPAHVVALMMVQFKASRSSLNTARHHADNYVDMHAYAKFADAFKLKEQNEKSEEQERPRAVRKVRSRMPAPANSGNLQKNAVLTGGGKRRPSRREDR